MDVRGHVARPGEMLVATTAIWDLYLDPEDAALILEAAVILERHRAAREPLPFGDAARLLGRLRTVALIAADEANAWRSEAEERRLEAAADGGRWGSVFAAQRMQQVAQELADSSQLIATAALAAADDLAPRLTEPPDESTRRAAAATVEEARVLLARYDRERGDT